MSPGRWWPRRWIRWVRRRSGQCRRAVQSVALRTVTVIGVMVALTFAFEFGSALDPRLLLAVRLRLQLFQGFDVLVLNPAAQLSTNRPITGEMSVPASDDRGAYSQARRE